MSNPEAVKTEFNLEKFYQARNLTIKAFREKSDDKVTLQPEDLFFIDIGPVFDGYEGDYGKTFTLGNNLSYLKISTDVQVLFDKAQSLWLEGNASGIELYQFLKKEADKLGYVLNPAMIGHRLADFPHAIYYKGKLGEFTKTPVENLWVLEVLIRHPSNNFGAFFEDIIKKPT